MQKIKFIFVVFVFSFSCLLFSASPALSQAEDIAITTYYPSPFGVYQELQARRLVVGTDTAPLADGYINFQDGIVADPAWNDSGVVYFNDQSNQFRYFDGAGWRSLGPPCLRRNFVPAGPIGGTICPVNYAVAMAPARPEDTNGLPVTNGTYLCCPFCNDIAPEDGVCD